jgi:hypothetical protein
MPNRPKLPSKLELVPSWLWNESQLIFEQKEE